MKRPLIILTILAVMLVPGLAQATSFVFGSVFDEQKTLGENLTAAVGSLDAFIQIDDFGTIDTAGKYIFTGIGYSQKAVDAGLQISVDHSVVGSTSIGFDMTPEYSADELMIRFTDFAKNLSDNALLSDLLTNSGYVKEAYKIDQDIIIGTGSETYTFVAGTIFISFTIPDLNNYENKIDFILAISPSAVPVPAAAWLLGSGLAGLLTLRRRLR